MRRPARWPGASGETMITSDDLHAEAVNAQAVAANMRQLRIKMAKLLVGGLRQNGVDDFTLRELKKELRSYDIVKRKWKTK